MFVKNAHSITYGQPAYLIEMEQNNLTDNSFLPDFCSPRMVFVVVLLAELLALVFSLALPASPAGRLSDLAVYSMFIQWLALACVATLCLSRAFLNRFNDIWAATWSYLLTLAVIFLVAELCWRVSHLFPAGVDFHTAGHGMFVFRCLGIGAIVSALALRYFYVQHQWRKRIKLESEARFQALQSRIRPHFLFNCMNTIASLTRSDARLAEESVEDLADLFRASLQESQHLCRLEDEIDLCKRYLRIEKHRLGDRLSVEWDIDGLPMRSRIPTLSLQPILENAIYHGIEPMADGGTIEIRAENTEDYYRLHIKNPLSGEASTETLRDGNQLAQDNVRQRLEACFEGKASLQISASPDEYLVSLEIPIEHENPDR